MSVSVDSNTVKVKITRFSRQGEVKNRIAVKILREDTRLIVINTPKKANVVYLGLDANGFGIEGLLDLSRTTLPVILSIGTNGGIFIQLV
jgi:hypothetical protein